MIPNDMAIANGNDSANDFGTDFGEALGIPEVEPSSPGEERPGRVPFVRPIRPVPAKDPKDREDDFIEVRSHEYF